ncbi:hypothetical protein O9992_30590 [Vibrio lentus]|nr:hypothetical protein [Vibrio lentus]
MSAVCQDGAEEKSKNCDQCYVKLRFNYLKEMKCLASNKNAKLKLRKMKVTMGVIGINYKVVEIDAKAFVFSSKEYLICQRWREDVQVHFEFDTKKRKKIQKIK